MGYWFGIEVASDKYHTEVSAKSVNLNVVHTSLEVEIFTAQEIINNFVSNNNIWKLIMSTPLKVTIAFLALFEWRL